MLGHPFNTKDVTEVFITNIVKLHGFPASIVSDREKVFFSHLWKNCSSKWVPTWQWLNKGWRSKLTNTGGMCSQQLGIGCNSKLPHNSYRYRWNSLAKRRNEKLSPRFYGPYLVLEKIRPVAYSICYLYQLIVKPTCYSLSLLTNVPCQQHNSRLAYKLSLPAA